MAGLRARPVVVVAAMVGLVACGGGEDRPAQGTATGASGSGTATGAGSGTHAGKAEAFPRSEATTEVRATLRDFRIDGIPDTVSGPKVFFEVRNEGPSSHEFHLTDSQTGREVGEIHEFGRGETKTLAVELSPGRYRVQCLLESGGRKHAEQGMDTTFSVS